MGQTTVVQVTEEDVAAAEAAIAEADGTTTPEETATEETSEETTEEGDEPKTEAPETLEITPTDEKVEAEITGQLDMEALGQEYAADGELSEASRATVLAALTPKFGDAADNVLDSYLAGIDAQVNQIESVAFEAAGGVEAFKAMAEWAADNAPPKELAAYNAAVNTPGYTRMAVRDMRAIYETATGNAPAAVDTSRVSAPAVTSGGGGSINSMQQLSEAVSTEKYANDPGHRAVIDQQIEAAAKAGRI